MSPLDVRSIYASTAVGVPTTRGGSTLDSVLLQGGGEFDLSSLVFAFLIEIISLSLHLTLGLIQADKALATGSIISPYELQLNDTTFLNATQQVVIKNSNKFPVTYTFSSSEAVALGTYDKVSRLVCSLMSSQLSSENKLTRALNSLIAPTFFLQPRLQASRVLLLASLSQPVS